jgi:O-antigen ligase
MVRRSLGRYLYLLNMRTKQNSDFRVVCVLASLITLIAAPFFTDPILLPKFILLVGSSISLWFYFRFEGQQKVKVLSHFKGYNAFWKDPILLAITCFLVSLLLSTVSSASPTTGFFGLAGRRNGLLTYFCLFLMFLFARRFSSIENLKVFFRLLAMSASLQACYMCIQRIGLDPLPWDLVYENSMIGTLGNPNFSSAFVAMGVPAIIYSSTSKDTRPRLKVFFKIMVIVSIVAIIFSGVYQGPLALALSTTVTIVAYAHLRADNWLVKSFTFMLAASGFLLTILGLIKLGPMAGVFAKQTFQIRSNGYWPVSIDMFKENPVLGFGTEQYGNYFPQFFGRELRDLFGPILTDNAHNFFLHFLAEGGLLVSVSYLAFSVFVIVNILRSLKFSSSLLGFVALATYFSFLGQSLVSIDHLGISVWIWILAGLFSRLRTVDSWRLEEPREKSLKTSSSNAGKKVLGSAQVWGPSIAVSLFVIVPLIFLATLDNKIWKLENSLKQGPSMPVSQRDLSRLGTFADLWPVDPVLLSRSSSILLSYAQLEKGFEILNRASSLSPESPTILNLRASATEAIVGRASAEGLRAEQIRLEPFNPQISLEYIRNLIAAKKIEAASFELIRLKGLGNQVLSETAEVLVESAKED